MTIIIVYTILLFFYASIVSYCDIKYSTIYNKLTFSFFIIGTLVNCAAHGFAGLTFSIIGTLAGLSLLLIPFILGWVGGGDVKYLASVGSLVGGLTILYSTILGLIFSGIAAIVYLLIHKRFKKLLIELIFAFRSFTLGIEKVPLSNYGKLPLGVFLSFGICIVWIYLNFIK
jgi:prepilin peptidase CpaA